MSGKGAIIRDRLDVGGLQDTAVGAHVGLLTVGKFL